MKDWSTTWKYPSELLLPSEKVNRPWPQILPARNSEVKHHIKCDSDHGHVQGRTWPTSLVLHPINSGENSMAMKPALKNKNWAKTQRQVSSLFLVKKNLHEFALVTWAVRKSHHLTMKANARTQGRLWALCLQILLAVQDSSIGDIVSDWLSQWVSQTFDFSVTIPIMTTMNTMNTMTTKTTMTVMTTITTIITSTTKTTLTTMTTETAV